MVCTGLLLTLSKALQAIGDILPGKFLVCTDSQSAIQGQQFPDFTYPLMLELCMTYHGFPKWHFRTVLACVGISGNKVADPCARDSTVQGNQVLGVFSLDLRTTPHWCMLVRCQQNCNHIWDNKLQDVKPVLLAWRSSCQ